jgi:hypothetical protein
MKNEGIILLGVGDILIDRDDPYSIFQHVSKVLQSADIVYAKANFLAGHPALKGWLKEKAQVQSIILKKEE